MGLPSTETGPERACRWEDWQKREATGAQWFSLYPRNAYRTHLCFPSKILSNVVCATIDTPKKTWECGNQQLCLQSFWVHGNSIVIDTAAIKLTYCKWQPLICFCKQSHLTWVTGNSPYYAQDHIIVWSQVLHFQTIWCNHKGCEDLYGDTLFYVLFSSPL